MVRKTGGPQSETCCPTVGTEQDVDNDFNEETESTVHLSKNIDNNIEVTEGEQNEQTVCNNDMSSPLIPLITELGVSNESQDSK